MLHLFKPKLSYLVFGIALGILWASGLGHAIAQSADTAAALLFDNTTSALTATNVQDAIDEVEGRLDTVEARTFSIPKYSQTGLTLALNTPVTVTHNLNTTSPVVSISITGGGPSPTPAAVTNYRVINANTITVWQVTSTTFTADVVVIAP